MDILQIHLRLKLNMELISHRGFWKTENQKNTKEAIASSFNNGWGIETDIRDFKEQLVISHDVACCNDYTLTFLFEQYIESGVNNTLALNIKADGLATKLSEMLLKYKINNYFVFDMSIPETLKYLNAGINVFIRNSEYETSNAELYRRSAGIWLDTFESVWYDNTFIENNLKINKKIAFVSSELHNRNEMKLWKMIKENNWHQSAQTILCTDIPDAAKIFFSF